ncbi:DUF3047 domain-containing protein [Methylomonas albis]|uniref:DUF3047 domain-containing protein n=1 Tax=Methylomonas albis TaxID=1854563 RepID=A0ABR9D471_9GAMM|nr:DUF3047 domain-containing protein [Methylomonas albis]MBD9357920.1 DUF3047 domain-containing protein [Methylomonas albis]
MTAAIIIDLKAEFAALLQTAEQNLVRDFHFLSLASDLKPWQDTGIELVEGDCLTTFVSGQTRFKDLPLSLEADFQVWFRIGLDGEVFRGTRQSHSCTATRPGRLFIGSYFPGEWTTKSGDLATPDAAYAMVTGDLSVLVIRWQDDALKSLQQLSAPSLAGHLIAQEIDRLQSPVLPPENWHYLWFLGEAEIYRACQTPENTPAVCCHTHNDTGIIQKSVVLDFMPDTLLRWAWKIEVLPSAVREDTLPTHDYLSIAVEFDNGQDITYYWSAELAPETAYRCPIPTWQHRETHVVIRSGAEGLGQWFNEERNLYADYVKTIGGDLPGKIVKVWLIAVSLFQHQEGHCQYADINILSNQRVIPIL